MRFTVLNAPPPKLPPPPSRTFIFELTEAGAQTLYAVSNWYKMVIDQIPEVTSPVRSIANREVAKSFLHSIFKALQPVLDR